MIEAKRRNSYKLEQEALNNLPRIIEESVMETQDLRRQYGDFRQGTDLLSRYKKTKRYERVYGEAQRLKRKVRRPRDSSELSRSFAGLVFRDIAYASCAFECHDSSLVFSPEKTSEFWKMLYANKGVIDYRFGQEALKRVHVPNGILVDRSKPSDTSNSFVLRLYEYSLVRDEKYLEKELKEIRFQCKRFPGLFAEADIKFVIPRTFPSPELEGGQHNVDFLQLPITRVEFGHFINDLYNSMR
ncbi:MAG: hypothetical protein AAB583_06190 [Patescibacteria group bacterium]|mgnify:FL=1